MSPEQWQLKLAALFAFSVWYEDTVTEILTRIILKTFPNPTTVASIKTTVVTTGLLVLLRFVPLDLIVTVTSSTISNHGENAFESLHYAKKAVALYYYAFVQPALDGSSPDTFSVDMICCAK